MADKITHPCYEKPRRQLVKAAWRKMNTARKYYQEGGWALVLNVIYKKVFFIQPTPVFSGWGMTTTTFTPWYKGGGDDIGRDFLRANKDILDKIARREFNLSQFRNSPDLEKDLSELMWRHYIVSWSVRYAARATDCSVKNLVECGVCDGLTAYFAMTALKSEHFAFRAFLYDAWEGMKSAYLLDSEKDSAGSYDYLSVESTRNNLISFEKECSFVKGFIPGSFASAARPDEIVWLHIDLNSSLPTTASLEFFFEKIPPGGVVLFDDYASRSYYDTKVAVDNFFAGKSGALLHLPTGQAIYFKR